VQEVRSWRTRVLKPGPPSDEYLLRKLLYCERCGARMHGTRGSKTAIRRYMCSTRRYGHSCGERIVKAHELEAQLIDWIRDFQPQGELLDLLLHTLKAASTHGSEPTGERRAELLGQLQRLQDLYVLGDLTKAQYVMRRQALEEEVQRLGPPTDPAIERARDLLEQFPRFWELETDPSRAPQAPALPARASLGARRPHRRRAAPRRLRAVLPSRSAPPRNRRPRNPNRARNQRQRGKVVPKAGATGVRHASGTTHRDPRQKQFRAHPIDVGDDVAPAAGRRLLLSSAAGATCGRAETIAFTRK
jgi:hypothetical protein